MQYVITRNVLDGNDMNRTSFDKLAPYRIGPCAEIGDRKYFNMPHHFRLLDDDGEVYFMGWSSDCETESAFRPLEEFGAAYGCTSIEYQDRRTGKWEVL